MRAPTLLHTQPLEYIEIGDGRRLRVLEVLGKGSSSVVHRAELESRNGLVRLVALKLFNSVGSEEAQHINGLAASIAQRAAWVRHPNVVETYDVGHHGTRPYFVTELVEGVSLQTLLERHCERGRRLPLDLALFIGCEIVEALSGARTARDHRGMQVGLLHLSLGARKVLLGWRGEVKVTDFESSMARSASSSIRSLRAVAHRTTTMAPEVAQGMGGDGRSDVFSLGVLLRELFVGSRFPRDVTNAEAMRLAREGFVQPISFQPHLPEPLVEVMLRALHVDPADRYPNASAMAFDLRRVAFAMGVGDGRVFLQRALDREWGNDASETTKELPYNLPEAPSPVRPDDLVDLESLPTIARIDDGASNDAYREDELLDADLVEDDS